MNYPAKLLFSALLFLGIVGIFNYRADSHLMSNIASISNADFHNRDLRPPSQRIYKPYHFQYFRPTAVLTGTSRSSTLDPKHPTWEGENGYNFYFAGQGNYELGVNVEFILSQPQVKKLLIGLDFTKFLTGTVRYQPGFDKNRVLPPEATLRQLRSSYRQLKDYYNILFTPPGLKASLNLIFQSGTYPVYTIDGVWRMNGNAFSLNGLRRNYLKTMSKHLLEDFQPELEMSYYENLLRTIYSHGNVDTRLLITPVHLYWLVGIDAAGYLDTYRQWHHQLIDINMSIAKEFGRPTIPIYAFNHFQKAISNPVKGKKKITDDWFHDFSHMKPKFSNKIMSFIWNDTANNDFGVQLGPENIDDYLIAVDNLRKNFSKQQKLHEFKALNRMKVRYGQQEENTLNQTSSP